MHATNYACLWTWMAFFHLNFMLDSLNRPHPRQFDSSESYTWQSLWYDTVVSTEQTTVVHLFSYLIYNVTARLNSRFLLNIWAFPSHIFLAIFLSFAERGWYETRAFTEPAVDLEFSDSLFIYGYHFGENERQPWCEQVKKLKFCRFSVLVGFLLLWWWEYWNKQSIHSYF